MIRLVIALCLLALVDHIIAGGKLRKAIVSWVKQFKKTKEGGDDNNGFAI